MIQQASEQQLPVIQQPPVQQAYGQQPSGLQTALQQPLLQQPSEQPTVYPQPSLPSNPGLDAPEPVIVPVTPVNTANSNSPVSGSGPIRQTTEWSPAPQSTPAPLSAAPQPALTQPAVAQTPASQTPAPWSSAPWFHARQTPAPQPPAPQQSARQQAAPTKPAPKPAAAPLPSWSDRPIHSFSAPPVVSQPHDPNDGPTIIPGALPAAPTDAAAAPPSH